jgi:hypothetical protein
MQAGIIGLPSCGKTTVFRALTGLAAGAASGPRAPLQRGVVKVPDERLDELARRSRPEKVVHAEIVFTDVPGPGHEDGAERPRSISPRFVGDMRTMDLLVHVLRAFTPPTGEPPSPESDLRELEQEMILQDLDVVERRLGRLRKGEKSGFAGEAEVLERIAAALESSTELRAMDLDEETVRRLSGFAFLTLKPRVIVVSVEDGQDGGDDSLERRVSSHAESSMTLAARLEMELAELPPPEREEFMREMGIAAAGTERFIRDVYRDLGLVSFFTIGDDEVRAWTIEEGTRALEAAGKIHTDMQRGFIRADVMSFKDLVELGDEAACRRAGRLRQEGKDYVIRDGDIVNVRFNV